jgi:hypothetical protein
MIVLLSFSIECQPKLNARLIAKFNRSTRWSISLNETKSTWCDVPCVFLIVLGTVDEIRSLLKAEIDFITQNMNVKQFPNVLFPLIGIQSFLCGKSLSYFGKLCLYSFGLWLFIFAGSDIRNELVESSHVGSSCNSEHLKKYLNLKLKFFYIFIL